MVPGAEPTTAALNHSGWLFQLMANILQEENMLLGEVMNMHGLYMRVTESFKHQEESTTFGMYTNLPIMGVVLEILALTGLST